MSHTLACVAQRAHTFVNAHVLAPVGNCLFIHPENWRMFRLPHRLSLEHLASCFSPSCMTVGRCLSSSPFSLLQKGQPFDLAALAYTLCESTGDCLASHIAAHSACPSVPGPLQCLLYPWCPFSPPSFPVKLFRKNCLKPSKACVLCQVLLTNLGGNFCSGSLIQKKEPTVQRPSQTDKESLLSLCH